MARPILFLFLTIVHKHRHNSISFCGHNVGILGSQDYGLFLCHNVGQTIVQPIGQSIGQSISQSIGHKIFPPIRQNNSR